jgi:hypothetical protein
MCLSCERRQLFYLNAQTSIVTLMADWRIGLMSLINGYP